MQTSPIEWSEFVLKIAEYTGVEADSISETTNLYNDLGMDSLGLFSMGMYLTKNYQVSIPVSSVAHIETVGEIRNMINEQIIANNKPTS